MSKQPLGRGLSSLIPQKIKKSNLKDSSGILLIETTKISSGSHQPRKSIDKSRLNELAFSIKEHGILQPLVVTKTEDNYEVIAGHRRLEAAKLINLKKVPVIIHRASNLQKLEMSLVENIQRDNLNPIEEAQAYKRLASEFNLTQNEIAEQTGKSRASIANCLRLLTLPIEIQKGIIQGKITEGHSRAILVLKNPEKQRALYEMIIKNNLTVREAEEKAKFYQKGASNKKTSVKKIDPEIREIEDKLSETLGTKVSIKKKGRNGKITIEFYSREELEEIISRFV